MGLRVKPEGDEPECFAQVNEESILPHSKKEISVFVDTFLEGRLDSVEKEGRVSLAPLGLLGEASTTAHSEEPTDRAAHFDPCREEADLSRWEGDEGSAQ
jgi:hypothetical protein